MYAVAETLTSNYNFVQQTVMKVKANALAKFLDALIVCKADIMTIYCTNREMKRLRAHQKKEYFNAAQCYICRHEYVENETMGSKFRENDDITRWLIGAAYCQCNLKRPVSFNIPVFVYNVYRYDAHVIVHAF